MTLYERLRLAIERGERGVVVTVVEGEPLGAKLLVLADGETVGSAPADLVAAGRDALDAGRSALVEVGGQKIFCDVVSPPPRLVIVGAVDIAESLCALAGAIGWSSVVADPRSRLATRERFPSAGELIIGWPDEAIARARPDRDTAVVVLTHDEKLDLPALTAALASDAFYVGALGSRRTQARRRERLLAAGLAESDLERIAGPCGLDLGAETPGETALSILGEILARRAGRNGGPLAEAKGRIHARREAGALQE